MSFKKHLHQMYHSEKIYRSTFKAKVLCKTDFFSKQMWKIFSAFLLHMIWKKILLFLDDIKDCPLFYPLLPENFTLETPERIMMIALLLHFLLVAKISF